MNQRQGILARLIQSVQTLDTLANDFVFVGGSVVPLLVTDKAAQDARHTTDVDVVVQVTSRSEYLAVEKRLALVGFNPDMQSEIMCRFKSGSLLLDVIPSDEKVLGFFNPWCAEALENYFEYQLSQNLLIKVIAPPIFICSKFCAYETRKKDDQKDMEDIIAVVDGRKELLDELQAAAAPVREFIATSMKAVLKEGFQTDLSWFLPPDAAGAARLEIVSKRLQLMTMLAG